MLYKLYERPACHSYGPKRGGTAQFSNAYRSKRCFAQYLLSPPNETFFLRSSSNDRRTRRRFTAFLSEANVSGVMMQMGVTPGMLGAGCLSRYRGRFLPHPPAAITFFTARTRLRVGVPLSRGGSASWPSLNHSPRNRTKRQGTIAPPSRTASALVYRPPEQLGYLTPADGITHYTTFYDSPRLSHHPTSPFPSELSPNHPSPPLVYPHPRSSHHVRRSSRPYRVPPDH